MNDSIELSIGGTNKGFVAVLNDTEQKAKQTADRATKELDKVGANGVKAKGKITSDLNAIAGEFARCTTISGAFETGLSKIGSSLKIAGLIGLVAAFGKGIYDATGRAGELQDALEKINLSNRGGASNRAIAELESNLSTIQEARATNQKVLAGNSTDVFKAAGSVVSKKLADIGATFTGIESITPEERETRLRIEEEKALKRIADKQREIFGIEKERILGNREGAEIMQIEAVYAEKIQAAIKARNTELQKSLQIERDDLISAAKRQQGVALAGRVSLTGIAAMRAGDAARAVGMTAEDEQRQARGTALAEAKFSESDALTALNASPKDPDLEAKYTAAVRNTERVNAENAKWERDIARSKGDAVMSQKAGNDALRLTLDGNSLLAEKTKSIAANKLAIVRAEREGNTELAAQLRVAGELELKAITRARIMDGGRARSLSEVRSGLRQEEVNARIGDRVASRLEDSDGLVVGRVGRSPRASKVLGLTADQSGQDITTSRLDKPFGSIDFKSELAQKGIGAMLAKSEMRFKRGNADIGASRAQKADAANQARLDSVKGGTASTDVAISRMAQLMEAWNN